MDKYEFSKAMNNFVYSRWPDMREKMSEGLLLDWMEDLKNVSERDFAISLKRYARKANYAPKLKDILDHLPPSSEEKKPGVIIEYGVFIQCVEAGQMRKGYFEATRIHPTNVEFSPEVVSTIAANDAKKREELYGGRWIVRTGMTHSQMVQERAEYYLLDDQAKKAESRKGLSVTEAVKVLDQEVDEFDAFMAGAK